MIVYMYFYVSNYEKFKDFYMKVFVIFGYINNMEVG